MEKRGFLFTQHISCLTLVKTVALGKCGLNNVGAEGKASPQSSRLVFRLCFIFSVSLYVRVACFCSHYVPH